MQQFRTALPVSSHNLPNQDYHCHAQLGFRYEISTLFLHSVKKYEGAWKIYSCECVISAGSVRGFVECCDLAVQHRSLAEVCSSFSKSEITVQVERQSQRVNNNVGAC